MAKLRQGKHDEVMLIPFLDILCSLIGVLILIIVVVCLIQTQRIKGRTKEDIQKAQRHQTLLSHQKTEERAIAELRKKLAEMERLQRELEAKQQRLVELRKRQPLSPESVRENTLKVAALQKQLEALMPRIEALAKTTPPLAAEIEKLKKLLAERQKKPDEKPALKIVRSSGSGFHQGESVFFVEVSETGIVINKGKNQKIRVAKEKIGEDKEYNAFLQKVKTTANAALIFLIRRDGWYSYLTAAGWAEQGFGLNTAKLPLPNDDPVDLSQFETY